jgi:hypothetical protein
MTDVIIVCHTEYGYIDNKQVIYDKTVADGVTKGVPNLIDVADKYGAKVTFAVMPEIIPGFPKNIKHEIGLHIHPGWEEFRAGNKKYYVGDYYLKKHCAVPVKSTVLMDYTYEEQSKLITAGKKHLSDSLDIDPEVFVSGRWSINNDTVRVLVENGMTHDCSAVPHKKSDHYDWSRLNRICMPYHPDQSDYQKQGDLPLVVTPVSQALLNVSASLDIVPYVGLPWLKACFLELYTQKAPVFHICLHSPAMTDPYFTGAMDELLKFISGHQVDFKFASEIKAYNNIELKSKLSYYVMAVNRNFYRGLSEKIS